MFLAPPLPRPRLGTADASHLSLPVVYVLCFRLAAQPSGPAVAVDVLFINAVAPVQTIANRTSSTTSYAFSVVSPDNPLFTGLEYGEEGGRCASSPTFTSRPCCVIDRGHRTEVPHPVSQQPVDSQVNTWIT